MRRRSAIFGVDIGTTSICAVAVDPENGHLLAALTHKNRAALPTDDPWRKEQDTGMLLAEVRELIDALLAQYDPAAIALTGQMHGIVYVDEAGKPLSPLYTWQDGRGGLPLRGGSACEKLGIPEGYGFATHLYMAETGAVPTGASCICTAADLAAMALCGSALPRMHTTNAASLGLFDIEKSEFLPQAEALMSASGMVLPRVTGRLEPVGEFRGVPVFCAVGDNQAAFRAACGAGEVLLNFGTGSQVSFLSESPKPLPGLEVRPYLNGKFIQSGSALCGGRAYAALAACFAAFDRARGMEADVYDTLGRLAEEALRDEEALQVDTAFAGTREIPSRRGSICGISEKNLTPGHLALGTLRGMVEELYLMYEKSGVRAVSLVLSGNAARKNPLLCTLAETRFRLPARLCPVQEEAAVGAALAAGEEMRR
ncbi:MAG: hypothetical protein J6S59_00330 [Clostridia bacterium]|nr:hypothetical protein [Clostridia bacterium]